MSNKGQALVELGISFVFLMFLLAGVVEFGIVFFQYVQLRDAAQEGALFTSANLQRNTVSLEQRVRYASDSPLNLTDGDIQVFVSVNGGAKTVEQACEGDGLEVVVQYPHRIFMPFMPQLLGSDVIMLRGRVVNTVLNPVCS
jgi:Flp pilus assembly protein TadG